MTSWESSDEQPYDPNPGYPAPPLAPHSSGPPPYGPPPYPPPYGPPPYPPPYPPVPHGYAPPGYAGYAAYPGYPYGEQRAGTLLAASILGYIAGGLLIVAGLLLFLGASFIADWDNATGQYHASVTAQLVISGVFDVIAAGLLIGGGVAMAARGATGRVLYTIGNAVVMAETIYWLARWLGDSDGEVAVWAIMFSALAIVGTVLAWTPTNNRWLRDPA